MSPRPATAVPLALGILAGEAVTLAADGQAPEWIKVTPKGKADTRDGRSFTFDPTVLAARFQRDGVDVAVDVDHGLALRAARGEKVDAVGYASAVEARADGTYARIDWNESGRAVLAARTHRYVSPTFHHDAQGNAVWLHSVSLVAAPALTMPALLHALGNSESPMKEIAKALGLPETADEAACLAAIAGRVEVKPLAKALGLSEAADGATCLSAVSALRTGGGEALVAELQSQLATTSARLASVEKAGREKEVSELLEAALKDRKIVPAQREHLAALCASDDGLKGVKAMLAATTPGLQPSGLGSLPSGEAGTDPVTLAAEARKIVTERAAAGQKIGWSEAVALAAAKKA
ncbi:phage protease [Methylorubrum zatmanii]